jgi:site-specific DNA-methyltransferase (adenine-specific)
METAPFLELHHRDIREYREFLLPESVDRVITDPPYSKKFLWVYDVLGEMSAYVLKPL